MNNWAKALVAMALTACSFGGQAAEAHWVATWSSSPLGGKIVIPGVPADKIPPSPTVHGTIRFRLPLNQGGSRLRLRLSNEANGQPLSVGAVTVGLAETALTIRAGTLRAVNFSGRAALKIPAGAPAVSDPIDLPTAAKDALIVSLYLPEDTQFPLGQRGIEAVVVDSADATSVLKLPSAQPAPARTPVSAVLVEGNSRAQTIVAFGDSITDGGVTDTPDVRGWPGHLANRLLASKQGTYAVANEGIGGNGIVTDIIGLNGLARFDRDVLSLPNVSYVVLLEGINDIGFASAPDNQGAREPLQAEQLISAYRQFIERAHQHGIKVMGCTLPPYKGAFYFSEIGEQLREAVNEWVRHGHGFDAVADFDKAVRDAADELRLNPRYDSGDHLHPSDAGYQAMANIIELKQFR